MVSRRNVYLDAKENCARRLLFSIHNRSHKKFFCFPRYPTLELYWSFVLFIVSLFQEIRLNFSLSSIIFSREILLNAILNWLGELMDHKNRGYYAASAHLLSRGHVSCWSRACPTGVFSSTIQIQQPWGKKKLVVFQVATLFFWPANQHSSFCGTDEFFFFKMCTLQLTAYVNNRCFNHYTFLGFFFQGDQNRCRFVFLYK